MPNRLYKSGDRLAPELVEELKERYLKGELYKIIQYKMGISHSTITDYVHRLGLPLRLPNRSKRVKHGTRSKSKARSLQAAG